MNTSVPITLTEDVCRQLSFNVLIDMNNDNVFEVDITDDVISIDYVTSDLEYKQTGSVLGKPCENTASITLNNNDGYYSPNNDNFIENHYDGNFRQNTKIRILSGFIDSNNQSRQIELFSGVMTSFTNKITISGNQMVLKLKDFAKFAKKKLNPNNTLSNGVIYKPVLFNTTLSNAVSYLIDYCYGTSFPRDINNLPTVYSVIMFNSNDTVWTAIQKFAEAVDAKAYFEHGIFKFYTPLSSEYNEQSTSQYTFTTDSISDCTETLDEDNLINKWKITSNCKTLQPTSVVVGTPTTDLISAIDEYRNADGLNAVSSDGKTIQLKSQDPKTFNWANTDNVPMYKTITYDDLIKTIPNPTSDDIANMNINSTVKVWDLINNIQLTIKSIDYNSGIITLLNAINTTSYNLKIYYQYYYLRILHNKSRWYTFNLNNPVGNLETPIIEANDSENAIVCSSSSYDNKLYLSDYELSNGNSTVTFKLTNNWQAESTILLTYSNNNACIDGVPISNGYYEGMDNAGGSYLSHPTSLAFDGFFRDSLIADGWWSPEKSDNVANKSWIGYHFNDPVDIRRFKYYDGYSNVGDKYRTTMTASSVALQYSSDGMNWTTRNSFNNLGDIVGWRTCTVSDITKRSHPYWRILCTGGVFRRDDQTFHWAVSEVNMYTAIGDILNVAYITNMTIYGQELNSNSTLTATAIDNNTIDIFENVYTIENDYITDPIWAQQIADQYLYRYKTMRSYLDVNTRGIPQIELLDRITINEQITGINFDFIITSIKHSIKNNQWSTELSLESTIPTWTYSGDGISVISPANGVTNSGLPIISILSNDTPFINLSNNIITYQIRIKFDPLIKYNIINFFQATVLMQKYVDGNWSAYTFCGSFTDIYVDNYIISNLTPNNKYRFFIVVYNKNNSHSEYGSEYQIDIPTIPYINNYYIYQNGRQLEHIWQINGGIDKVEIRRLNSANLTWDFGTILNTGISGQRYIDTEIATGTWYYGIMAMTSDGQYYGDTIIQSITITNIPSSNVIVAMDEFESLDGTFDDCYLSNNTIILDIGEIWEESNVDDIWDESNADDIWGLPVVESAIYITQIKDLGKLLSSYMSIDVGYTDGYTLYWKYSGTDSTISNMDWTPFITGVYTFRYHQYKLELRSGDGTQQELSSFTVDVDVPDRILKYPNSVITSLTITDANDGIRIDYSEPFIITPTITGSVINAIGFVVPESYLDHCIIRASNGASFITGDVQIQIIGC